MGGVHSRRRDSYNQTPPDDYRNTYIEETLGRRFTSNDKPATAGPTATAKVSLSAPPAQPSQKSQKHDRKQSVCNPRTILSIKEENVTESLTDQCTPKCSSSCAELKKSMRCKQEVKRQDAGDNLISNAALLKPECKQDI